nr:MAG TPA: hypothetical protein [Caudoviricetes sp.]
MQEPKNILTFWAFSCNENASIYPQSCPISARFLA